MAMSKKAQALLTGEKGAEWNKYQISMQQAYNDFAEEQAKAQEKQSKRSGWAKMLGTVAFVGALALTGGLAGVGIAGVEALTMAGGWSLATAATAGTIGAMTPQWTNPEIKLGKGKEALMANIYDPKFGGGQADVEKLALSGKIDDDITALKAYEEGGLTTALFENVGRSSSYIGSGGKSV